MDGQEIVKWSRKFRSHYFVPIGRLLLRAKFKANQITFFSLVFGLASVYFLFKDHFFFIVFILLHLACDGLDGVVARLTKPTLFGNYFDHITDQTVTFLIFLKIYFYLDDYYLIIFLSLFVLTYVLFFLSKFKAPVIYIRSGTAIALILAPLFPMKIILTISYLIAGAFIISSLIMQLRYFVRRV